MVKHGVYNSFLTETGPHPASQDDMWKRHKRILKQLYLDEGKALKYVMVYMEAHHNFKASKKVYKKRFAKWGFGKIGKHGRAYDVILRKIIQRSAVGKDTVTTWSGTTVYEFQMSIQDVCRFDKTRESTPPQLRCQTPTLTTGSSYIVNFAQAYAHDVLACGQDPDGLGDPTELIDKDMMTHVSHARGDAAH